MSVQQVPKISQSEFLDALVYVSGYRMGEVAKSAGLSRQAFQNALAGRFNLSEEATRRVCRYLHVLPERVLQMPK